MTNQLANTAEIVLSESFRSKKESVRNRWTIRHAGAGLGLLGGTFILACASFLTIFQFVYGENPHGSWLFAVVLPLWILGAHCFDKIEEIERAARIENCALHGMAGESE